MVIRPNSRGPSKQQAPLKRPSTPITHIKQNALGHKGSLKVRGGSGPLAYSRATTGGQYVRRPMGA